eukprot:Opistho-2@13146
MRSSSRTVMFMVACSGQGRDSSGRLRAESGLHPTQSGAHPAMKLPSRRYLVLVLSLLAVGQAPAQTPGGLDRLAWLAGCWARDVSARAEAGSGEQWMAPVGGSMLGVSRTIRGGKTVEHEFMQLRVGADGVLAFTAKPSGQAEASFPLLRPHVLCVDT